MTLVDLIADYVIMHLTAQHRHDLAEFVEAYLEEVMFSPAWMAAKQFRESMEKIQRSAGHSQEEFGKVSQALLAMAKEQES